MNTKEEVMQILYDHDVPEDFMGDCIDAIENVYIRATTQIEIDNIKQLKRRINRFRIKVMQLKAGAYCAECGRYYPFREWDILPRERIYPQYMACYTVCECGSNRWTYIR